MVDYVSWDVDCEDDEVEALSPVLRGRLLRLKVTQIAGASISEGSIDLRLDSYAGRPLVLGQVFFNGNFDVSPRWPVNLLVSNVSNVAEYSQGYSVVEAPVLWGPLYLYLGLDTQNTRWRFEAILES